MAFRVEIEPRALDDLDAISSYITARGSFAAAEKWFNGIMDEMMSLAEMPERCFLVPESKDLGEEVRILWYGRKDRSYKAYFSVQFETQTSGVVQVFHVRHWARTSADADELRDLMDEVGSESDENPNAG